MPQSHCSKSDVAEADHAQAIAGNAATAATAGAWWR